MYCGVSVPVRGMDCIHKKVLSGKHNLSFSPREGYGLHQEPDVEKIVFVKPFQSP